MICESRQEGGKVGNRLAREHASQDRILPQEIEEDGGGAARRGWVRNMRRQNGNERKRLQYYTLQHLARR